MNTVSGQDFLCVLAETGCSACIWRVIKVQRGTRDEHGYMIIQGQAPQHPSCLKLRIMGQFIDAANWSGRDTDIVQSPQERFDRLSLTPTCKNGL